MRELLRGRQHFEFVAVPGARENLALGLSVAGASFHVLDAIARLSSARCCGAVRKARSGSDRDTRRPPPARIRGNAPRWLASPAPPTNDGHAARSWRSTPRHIDRRSKDRETRRAGSPADSCRSANRDDPCFGRALFHLRFDLVQFSFSPPSHFELLVREWSALAASTFRNAFNTSVVVMMPTNLPSSTTGRPPILCSIISRAASSTLILGVTVFGSAVIAAVTLVDSRYPACARTSRSEMMPTSLSSSTTGTRRNPPFSIKVAAVCRVSCEETVDRAVRHQFADEHRSFTSGRLQLQASCHSLISARCRRKLALDGLRIAISVANRAIDSASLFPIATPSRARASLMI